MNCRKLIFIVLPLLLTLPSLAQIDDATRQLSHDIFKQLIEINTTDSVGNVTTAAEAMAQRFRDAGFSESDIHVLGPNDRKKNLVVRLHGTGKHKPVLLIGHLDVVEARREDWTTDPFQFVEKDGYYYGRGTQDMKDGDAIMVTTLIRFKKEGYVPDRDIILALTADEEGGKFNGVDWLVTNHRELIDAEFVLNHDGGGVMADHGKAVVVEVDATEKIYADFQLTVTNPRRPQLAAGARQCHLSSGRRPGADRAASFSLRAEQRHPRLLQAAGGGGAGAARLRHAGDPEDSAGYGLRWRVSRKTRSTTRRCTPLAWLRA